MSLRIDERIVGDNKVGTARDVVNGLTTNPSINVGLQGIHVFCRSKTSSINIIVNK